MPVYSGSGGALSLAGSEEIAVQHVAEAVQYRRFRID